MQRPNIIVIVSDDQGYGDLSCMGAPDVRTPNLDALADSGVLFDTFYSNSPVCSPSRASLLTGKYPGNAGLRSIVDGHRKAPGLLPSVRTMPSILGSEGYSTCLIGKWHLGVAEGSRPTDHGFDHFFGFLSGNVDYYSHINWGMNNRTLIQDGKEVMGTPVHDLWEANTEVWDDGRYMTEVITEKACDFVHDKAATHEPFFLQVAYNAPHYPLHAPEKYKDRFRHLPPRRMIIAAMISAMDDGIGQILNQLENEGIRENTVVFFMSDNGPSREIRNWLDGSQDAFYGSSSGRLKGHKFSLFEGGVRVPGIISYPHAIPSSQRSTEPVMGMDILPTMLDITGIELADDDLDGISLLPHLQTGQPLPHRTLHWEQGPQNSVRKGKWKLVLDGQLVEEEGPQDPVFLSDIEQDPGELTNLAAQYPEIVQELTDEAILWRQTIENRWEAEWLPQLESGTSFARPTFVR